MQNSALNFANVQHALSQHQPHLLDNLRRLLTPRGSTPHVGLQTSGVGIWLPTSFIDLCITQVEAIPLQNQLGNPPNHLEKIAFQLLCDSAYITTTKNTDVLHKLRTNLQPKGSAQIVGLRSAAAGIWLPFHWIQKALTELETIPMRTILGEPPTPLEKVAFMLLCDSAGMEP